MLTPWLPNTPFHAPPVVELTPTNEAAGVAAGAASRNTPVRAALDPCVPVNWNVTLPLTSKIRYAPVEKFDAVCVASTEPLLLSTACTVSLRLWESQSNK